MWKKFRRNYRRLVAFLLTAVIVGTNVCGNVGVAFAAGMSESALFLVDGEELREAIQEAKEHREVFSFSKLELAAARKSIRNKYEKLLGKKDGEVYELDLEVDDSYAPEGAAVQVFYHAGTEDVVFLFLNETDMEVEYRVNIDGYETEPVTVKPNTFNIEEEDASFGENYEAADMIDDVKTAPKAEVVETKEAPAGEKSEEAGKDETADDVSLEGKEESSAADKTLADEEESRETEADTTEAALEEETEKAGETEAADKEDEETGAQAEEEQVTETEAEPETETEPETEAETEIELEDINEVLDEREGETLSKSNKQAAIVAVSLEDLEEESTKETEVSAEEETEAAETETEEETEAEDSAEGKTEEAAGSETTEAEDEETEAEAEETEAETEEESKAEDAETEKSTEAEETEAEETEKDATVEDTEAEDKTTVEETESEEETGKDSAGSSSSQTGSTDKMDGQLLEDDSIEFLGKLKGKDYATVTLKNHVNARAVKVAWEDIEEIISEDEEDAFEYLVDYYVNLPGGASVEGAESVAEGEDLYFAVEAEDNYEIIGVFANGEELEEVEDVADRASASDWKGYAHVYVVEAVEDDLVIDVEVEELADEVPVIAAAVYTAETDDAVFNVDVPDGAFAEEVELQVTKIEDEAHVEELKAQANELLKEGQSVADILVYDVTFISKETGAEIEPTETVGVSARMKAPVVSVETAEKELNITEISVVHLPDNKEAEVVTSTENVEETEFEFQTGSFSEIMFLAMTDNEAAKGAAKIGSGETAVYYEKLQDAVDAIGGTGEKAQPQGAEIVLLMDVKENIISTEKSYTLDMNGHTVDGDGKGSVFVFTNKNGGTVTLKNGTITGGKAALGGGIRAVGVEVAKYKTPFTLNVESCDIINNNATNGYGGGVSLGDTTTSGTIASNRGSVICGTWSDVKVEGNTGGGVHISGNNTKGTTIASKNTMTFENVTISGNKDQHASPSFCVLAAGLDINYVTLTIRDCSITGNGTAAKDAGGVSINGYSLVTFEGGETGNRIEGNTGKKIGGLYWMNGNVSVKDTVIKNNIGAGKNSGIYLEGSTDYTFAMDSGAVYNNGTGNDIYINLGGKRNQKATIIAANKMKDPDLGENFFAEYEYTWSGLKLNEAISKSGKGATGSYKAVAGKEPTKVAKIGDREYLSVKLAVEDAKAGETIELISPSGEGNTILSMLDTKVIDIDKELTFDLKGLNFSMSSDAELFRIVDGGKLTIDNTGDSGERNTISGIIIAEKGGYLAVGAGVALASAVDYKGDSLVINGEHENLNISLGEGKAITAGEGFGVTDSLNLTLDAKVLSQLNGNLALSDIVLVQGCPKETAEGLTKKIVVKDLNYKEKNIEVLVDEAGNIVLRKSDLSGIYLDGDKGDDSNSGLNSTSPVKTFEKAKELLATATNSDTIYVVGPVSVSGEDSWSLPKGQLKRFEKYTGALINVTGTLTLQDIVIDGGGKENVASRAALVTVASGGTLNVKDGAVLQNNTQSASNMFSEGGAITNNGTLEMTGGKIQYNRAYLGGGVHNRGTFRMSGGEISNNTADGTYGSIGTGERGACGGGVYVLGDVGEMRLTGGVISSNTATGTRSSGGGISLGSRNDQLNKGKMAKLFMDGGTITRNHADGWGGGINMSSETTAEITAGNITSNVAQGSKGDGIYNDYWVGGGIYVDGVKRNAQGAIVAGAATLQIKNVEIAENTAQWGGGGIAACPTATVEIYRIQGGVIHDNRSKTVYENYLSDILVNSTNYHPAIAINSYMLGGGKYNWRDPSSGKEVPYDRLNQERLEERWFEIYSDGNPADIAAGASDCDVHITNNSAKNKGNSASGRGGGIAVNGHLILGEAGGYRIVHTYFTKYLNGDVERDGAREPIQMNEIKLGKEIATDGEDVNGRKYVEHMPDYQGSQYAFVDYGLYYALQDARDVDYDEATGILTITGNDGVKTSYNNSEISVGEDGRQYASSYSIIVDKSGNKTIYLDYVRPTFTLDVEKLWRGDNNNAENTRKPVTIRVARKYDNVIVAEVKLDVNGETISKHILKTQEDGTAELTEIPKDQVLEIPGAISEYLIKEDTTDMPDYSDSYRIKVNEADENKHYEVTVTNTYGNPELESLTIGKEVVNGTELNGAEDLEWNFVLTLKDENGNSLDVVNKTEDETDNIGITAFNAVWDHGNGNTEPLVFELSSDDQIQFALKHNEKITIEGLPVGTQYKVVEVEANNGECATTVEGGMEVTEEGKVVGSQGSIAKDVAEQVTFKNTFLKRSTLTISKEVVNGTEENGAEDKDWNFTVTVKDENGNSLNVVNSEEEPDKIGLLSFPATLTHKDGQSEDMALEVSETDQISVVLKHGESITIKGIPVNAQYSVVEEEANAEDTVTTVNGGQIIDRKSVV